MTDVDYLRIAKWVLIVLLAGFIGQFGKSFAKHLMEKARLKRESSSLTSEEEPPIAGRGHIDDAPGLPKPHPATTSPEEKAKQDKKLAKTLVKQKKKEAKALKQ